jgi:DNA-binding winged helix-turn-helix (wHTH) protein
MASARRPSGTYVFHTFRLAADGTLLLHRDVPIALAPKVLQTLLVLVRRAGQVVTKTELLEEVWPDSFVEETGLTRNISVLRQALGPDAQQAIVTVARIGYRFDAPVRFERGAASAVRPNGPPPRENAAAVTDARTPAARRARLVVGRDRELRTLLSAFAEVESGAGRFIAVTGEAGIGKSTLVDEFVRMIPIGTALIGRGRCSRRFSGAEPHLPLLEALQELSAADPNTLADLRRIAPTWFSSVAPGDDGDRTKERPANSAERLLHELTVFFEHLSRTEPVIVILEDLHWSDVSTVDALAHLAARVHRMPVLLLATYRPAEMQASAHPFVPLAADLTARGELTTVALPLLPLAAVREYVAATLHETVTDVTDLDLSEAIHRRTEGNPLFMVDLVRYLQERRAAEGRLWVDAEIPDSLRSLIAHTLDMLPADLHAVLALGAIQGYEFDSAIVAEVSGRVPADVEERLSRASRVQGLLTPKGEHTLPDGRPSSRYRFVHVLYQEALYGSIAPSQRTVWARRIGEALLDAHSTTAGAVAGHLAVLFEAGLDYWRASDQFLTASRNAARRFAFHEAETLAARGLRCLIHVASNSNTARRETDLAFARFVALAAVEGYGSSQVEEVMRRLITLAGELGDTPTTAAALSARWAVHMARGECAAAKAIGQRFEAVARSSDNAVLLINAQMQSQIACHHLGEFEEADRYMTAIVAAAPNVPVADRLISIYDPVVGSLGESSRNAWITGRFTRAEAHSAEALALAREFGHPDSIAFASIFVAWLRGYRREWDGARATTEAAIAVAVSAGSVQTLAWNRAIRGWAIAHQGDVETGITEMSQAIAASRRISGWVAMPQFSAMIVECLLLRNRVADARRWLDEAHAFMATHRDCYFSAEVHRLTGRCLIASGDPGAAACYMREAMTIARSQGAITFELRAAIDLAAQFPDEGRQALQRIIPAFPEPSSWPDLADAINLIA